MNVVFRSGDLELEGVFKSGPDPARAAVICHPHPLYGGNMDNSVVCALQEGLQKAGFATLRFNFRGVGGSDGGYANGAGEQDDVRAAAEEVLRRTGCASCTLAGYSFGAMMVTLVGAELASADRLVIAAPPLSFGGLQALAECAKPKLFIAGDRDQYCDVSELQDAVARLAEPKQTRILAGADHFFGGFEDEISATVAQF